MRHAPSDGLGGSDPDSAVDPLAVPSSMTIIVRQARGTRTRASGIGSAVCRARARTFLRAWALDPAGITHRLTTATSGMTFTEGRIVRSSFPAGSASAFRRSQGCPPPITEEEGAKLHQ